MEALSKIGEFFFDDGRVTEEERLEAYREYKEKMRKQLGAKPGLMTTTTTMSSNNNNNNNKTNAISSTTKASKTAAASKTTKTKSTATKKTASTRTRTTGTRTTGTGEVVSSTDGTSSSDLSETSSTDELESMVPETVCADTSIRSVSTRSVISESGSGSHDSDEPPAAPNTTSQQQQQQQQQPDKGASKTTASKGTEKRAGSATAAAAKQVPGSAEPEPTHVADKKNDVAPKHPDNQKQQPQQQQQQQQQPPLQPVPLPKTTAPPPPQQKQPQPTTVQQIFNPLNRFLMGSAFRPRSTSTNYTGADDTLFSGTETGTFDDQGTLERKMVDQILGFIGLEDEEDDDEEDETTYFGGSHSTGASQDSHTEAGASPPSPLHHQHPQQQAAAAAATLFPAANNHAVAATSKKPPLAMTAAAATAPTIALQPPLMAGLQTSNTTPAATAAVPAPLSSMLPSSDASITRAASKSSVSVKTFTTHTSTGGMKTKAIHGWFEEEENDNEDDESGVAAKIELAISPCSTAVSPSPSVLSKSPAAAATMSILPFADTAALGLQQIHTANEDSNSKQAKTTPKGAAANNNTNKAKAKENKKATKSAAKATHEKGNFLTSMFHRKPSLPNGSGMAKGNSNLTAKLRRKSRQSNSTEQQQQQQQQTPQQEESTTDVTEAQDDGIKAFQSIFSQQHYIQEKLSSSSGVRSFDKIISGVPSQPNNLAALPFSQFFSASVDPDESLAIKAPLSQGDVAPAASKLRSLPTLETVPENDGGVPPPISPPISPLTPPPTTTTMPMAPPLINLLKSQVEGRPPICPSSTQPLKSQVEGRPPMNPSSTQLTQQTRERSDVSNASVLRGVTVTATCTGTMDSADFADVQEFIEVTYESAGPSGEDPLSKQTISSTISSPIKCSKDNHETLVETIQKDADGIYTRVGPDNSSDFVPASCADTDKAQERSRCPSPRSPKKLFGKRFTPRKKKKTDDATFKSQGSDVESSGVSLLENRRHLIGETSVFSGKPSSPSSQAAPMQQLNVTNRGGSAPMSDGAHSVVTEGTAKNGFKHAIGDLHVRTTWEEENATQNVDDGKQVDANEDGEQDVASLAKDQPSYMPDGALFIKDNQSSQTTKVRLPFFNRGKARGSDHSVSVSLGKAGIELTPGPEAEAVKSESRSWVRSINSVPRALKRTDANSRSSKQGSQSLPRARLPSRLPRNSKRQAPGTELAGNIHDDGSTQVYSNPWQIGHPNYGDSRLPARASTVPAPDDTTLTVDGGKSKSGMSLSRRYKMAQLSHYEKTQLKKALAKKLVEKKRAYLLSAFRHKDDAPRVENEMEQEEHTKGMDTCDDPDDKSKRKGLGKLTSGLKNVLSLISKKTKDVDESSSRAHLQTQDIGVNVSHPARIDEDDVGPLAAAGLGAGPPGGIDADDTFLMQHRLMQQSRKPSWQTPHLVPVTRGKGSGNSDRMLGIDGSMAALGFEKETRQAKLQRVLGARNRKKGDRDARYSARKSGRVEEHNSILDVHVGTQLAKIMGSISPSSSSSFSVSSGGNDSNDGTAGAASTACDTHTATDEQTAQYSVHNQRVLDTLRLLHAVKRRRRNRDESIMMKDCNDFIDPLIDGMEEVACGGRYSA